jgi:dihydrofolate reductase
MKRKTKISMIVAMDQKGVIGKGNELPWHLPTDLKNFKHITMEKPVIMGRKTHESIGKPLPGRRNIIITRNSDYHSEGCETCHNLDEAIKLCEEDEELIIIGGREIYRDALDVVFRIYLTEVHADVDGDVFFPAFDKGEWDLLLRDDVAADENNEYSFTMSILERRHPLYW